MIISILTTLALFISSNVKAQPLRRDKYQVEAQSVLRDTTEPYIVDCGKTSEATSLINSFKLNVRNMAEVNTSNELEKYGICLLHLTSDQANGLSMSKEIAFVERDHTITLPPLKEEKRGPRTASNSEDFPYGIKMIQAPYLWDKKPKEIMTICVVDTGYGHGHEDLPNKEDHDVKGPGPEENTEYKDWDDDGHGVSKYI